MMRFLLVTIYGAMCIAILGLDLVCIANCDKTLASTAIYVTTLILLVFLCLGFIEAVKFTQSITAGFDSLHSNTNQALKDAKEFTWPMLLLLDLRGRDLVERDPQKLDPRELRGPIKSVSCSFPDGKLQITREWIAVRTPGTNWNLHSNPQPENQFDLLGGSPIVLENQIGEILIASQFFNVKICRAGDNIEKPV